MSKFGHERHGAAGLQQLREATTGICNVIPLTAENDFYLSSTMLMSGDALLVDSSTSALEYHRTPAHIARGNLDHYHIALCLAGEMGFSSGRRDVTLRPGDVCLLDMAQPNRTVLTAERGRSRTLVLILQLSLLAPKLAHPDSATAVLLPASHHHARLLASQLSALWEQVAPSAEALAATIEAMADIIAGVAGRAADTEGDVERAEHHLYRAMIKRYIAANLETPSLVADDLCRRFEISRASLYRLFEADGGLARYIQEQRLNRALRLLVSPRSRSNRLIDLALDLQFSSDSSFVRAFRRHFGITPGEVRELSETWLRETGAVPGPDDLLQLIARR
ncbi:AraC family transcriptional regulator [Bradyrhizobium sp. LTSP885]|nr:AraC family transcriptional regulator [Bradyrhizobium sp. LTSP885]